MVVLARLWFLPLLLMTASCGVSHENLRPKCLNDGALEVYNQPDWLLFRQEFAEAEERYGAFGGGLGETENYTVEGFGHDRDLETGTFHPDFSVVTRTSDDSLIAVVVGYSVIENKITHLDSESCWHVDGWFNQLQDTK